MAQSKAESFVEAIVNTTVGLTVTMIALPLVNGLLGISMSVGQMSLSTVIFTGISIARGYIIRRFFNDLHFIKSKLKGWILQNKK